MESGRSKKVRSRRTPVANLASFAPRESGFLQTGIDGVPQRHAPRPSRQSACASRNRTFFAPRHPAIASPFPHPSADPSATRAPESIQARTPPRVAKTRRPPPSAPPTSVRPSLRASFQHPKRRPLHRCPPPRPNPSPSAASQRPHPRPASSPAPPPFASIELQAHPRRSDEIAIQTSPASPKRFRNSHFTPSKKESTA